MHVTKKLRNLLNIPQNELKKIEKSANPENAFWYRIIMV